MEPDPGPAGSLPNISKRARNRPVTGELKKGNNGLPLGLLKQVGRLDSLHAAERLRRSIIIKEPPQKSKDNVDEQVRLEAGTPNINSKLGLSRKSLSALEDAKKRLLDSVDSLQTASHGHG